MPLQQSFWIISCSFKFRFHVENKFLKYLNAVKAKHVENMIRNAFRHVNAIKMTIIFWSWIQTSESEIEEKPWKAKLNKFRRWEENTNFYIASRWWHNVFPSRRVHTREVKESFPHSSFLHGNFIYFLSNSIHDSSFFRDKARHSQLCFPPLIQFYTFLV